MRLSNNTPSPQFRGVFPGIDKPENSFTHDQRHYFATETDLLTLSRLKAKAPVDQAGKKKLKRRYADLARRGKITLNQQIKESIAVKNYARLSGILRNPHIRLSPNDDSTEPDLAKRLLNTPSNFSILKRLMGDASSSQVVELVKNIISAELYPHLAIGFRSRLWNEQFSSKVSGIRARAIAEALATEQVQKRHQKFELYF